MAATIGANIKTGSKLRSIALMNKYLAGRKQGGKTRSFPIYTKAGVPASNTAADDPGGSPAFILDTTNGDVYFCNIWTSSTSFTVVKVSS